LTQLFQPGEGTGRVRVLIWDGVLKLISPHDPLGIPGEFSDRYNIVRPLIGYGPESMFNAFAKVYPPELAHVERRGSSADRSHNETFDALAMMGALGFIAYYLLMFSVFYYLLKAVGWVPDDAARRRLLVLLVTGGLLGAVVPPLVAGDFAFSGLGLPAGMLFMTFVYLVWQALTGTGSLEQAEGAAEQSQAMTQSVSSREALLLLGIFMALVAHFVEVHFVFSIAATYVYFWAYAGVVVARVRWFSEAGPGPVLAEEGGVSNEPVGPRRGLEHETQATEQTARKRRRRRRKSPYPGTDEPTAAVATKLPGQPKAEGPLGVGPPRGEDWETWLGVHGLAVAIVLIAMVFDFVTAQFDITRGNFSMIWMFGITWGLGLAVGLGEVAVRERTWQKPISWWRALLLYVVISLGYSGFYLMIHRWQLRPRDVVAVDATQAVIKGANVFTGAFILFYIFVGLLLVLIAAMLTIPLLRRQPTWRVANWWLYPVLILAAGAVILFKNVDVVRADMYLKHGEQYRNQGEYDNAVTLHRRSIQFDPDEDFYYLMLALDYQLKGQDSRPSAEARLQAWTDGERVALQAREINPYNPDNTNNMGRYYLTWGQATPLDDVQRPVRFQKALEFFEKATKLAPQNVVSFNLWAQTYYVLGQYEQAENILKISVALDPEFEQTYMLLGDTYAALGRPVEATKAHRAAILLSPPAFADQFLEQRLNFYLSASQVSTDSATDMSPMQGIIAAFKEAQLRYPTDALIPRTLGRIYARLNDQPNALTYYDLAIQMGDRSAQTMLAVADMYLGLKDYEKAVGAYQQVLQRDPQNTQAHTNLGYIYSQLGRLDEAIQENLQVLQLAPDDYITHRNLALLYRDSGRLEEAIQQAQQLLEITPEQELATSYLLLGSLYEAAGDQTQALEVYKQAVTAAPGLYQAQAALGNLYLHQGNLEGALQAFETAAQLAPNDYAVHQQLAIIYQQLGRFDEALSQANQALSLAPEEMREALQSLVAQIERERG
jgi:tetratricopeptide (TPR) repeat protein